MNIVITWPKTRALGSYLAELAKAEERGHVAYYRLSSRPDVKEGDRCYHVHDGKVRGYLSVLGMTEFPLDGHAPIDNVTGKHFQPGIYVERHPHWFAINPVPMRGFQGFRYYREET